MFGTTMATHRSKASFTHPKNLMLLLPMWRATAHHLHPSPRHDATALTPTIVKDSTFVAIMVTPCHAHPIAMLTLLSHLPSCRTCPIAMLHPHSRLVIVLTSPSCLHHNVTIGLMFLSWFLGVVLFCFLYLDLKLRGWGEILDLFFCIKLTYFFFK